MSSLPTNIHRQVFDSQDTQLAAIFASHQEAQDAVNVITSDSNVNSKQITILDPDESELSQQIEADSKGIGRRMLASHVAMGAIGLLIGLVVAFILVSTGPMLTQQNPIFTYIALISPGLFIGIFVAGLFSLRPDRTELVETVRHALKQKHVALVVNFKNSQSIDKVKDVLSSRSATVVEAIR